MTKRLVLLFVLCALCTFVSSVLASDPDRPNILWLSTEDIGPQLGCYGYEIKTPNIDAFARRSLSYDVAWSNYPVCAPARTTIITGMYATALGAGNMRCAAVKPEGLNLLPELMREAGYYCTNASKTDYNLLDVNNVWDESSGKAHWKNRPGGKPFFAVFNYTKTHESKIRTRPHKQQIDPKSVSLYPYWPDTPEVRQDWAQYLDNIQTMDGWFQGHLKQIEAAGLKEDTIVIFWGDHGSGMPRHKRYAGDSGMRVPMIVHVPEKWKQYWNSNYAAGGHSDWPVGFIDLAPTVLKVAGATVPDRMQGNSFLGAEAVKSKYLFGVRNRMDERYDVSRSVTDGRFVYVRNFMPYLPHGQFVEYQQATKSTSVWYKMYKEGNLNPVQAAFWKPRPAEELFDLKADPYETTNLAAKPAHNEKLKELRKVVREKMIAIGDLDLVPESTLYEFEQSSGKTRVAYSEKAGFSFGTLFDAACGQSIDANLNSQHSELRFWAIVNSLMQLTEQSRLENIAKLLDDESMAVRVKAAEYCLSREVRVDESLDLLVKLADKNNSNYYVACNAVDCLDRYRIRLSDTQIAKIKAIPEDFSEVKRGNDNMAKLKRRFKSMDDSTSANKPRVLILGDSISMGYTPFVQDLLADEALVFRPMRNEKAAENCAGTDKGIQHIDRWLKDNGGQWDVIHVNFGLHDLKHVDAKSGKNSNSPDDPLQSDPVEYEKQLRQILEKVQATRAQVIVCTTTPVPPGCKPLREPESPQIYNQIAKKIAKENGFAVNDLYAFANERLGEIQKPANVHFSRKGSKMLAEKVAMEIRRKLPK